MFSNLFNKSSLGLDISDESLRFAELLNTKNGLQVGRYGERDIPPGTIESGKIKDPKKLAEILSKLRKEENIKSARVSLSNNNMENLEDYLLVFKKSGISIKSLESETLAISRAVIEKGDPRTHLIINFGNQQSAIFITSDGFLNHHSIIPSALYLARDEIAKHFLHWHIRQDKKEKNNPPIEKIILCGNEPNLAEFSEYLSVSLRNKVEVANVWVNILNTENYLPEINHKQSLAFTTPLGLALGGFKNKK